MVIKTCLSASTEGDNLIHGSAIGLNSGVWSLVIDDHEPETLTISWKGNNIQPKAAKVSFRAWAGFSIERATLYVGSADPEEEPFVETTLDLAAASQEWVYDISNINTSGYILVAFDSSGPAVDNSSALRDKVRELEEEGIKQKAQLAMLEGEVTKGQEHLASVEKYDAGLKEKLAKLEEEEANRRITPRAGHILQMLSTMVYDPLNQSSILEQTRSVASGHKFSLEELLKLDRIIKDYVSDRETIRKQLEQEEAHRKRLAIQVDESEADIKKVREDYERRLEDLQRQLDAKQATNQGVNKYVNELQSGIIGTRRGSMTVNNSSSAMYMACLVPHKPESITFRVSSRDQGWSSYPQHYGTYIGCHSWLEVGAIRNGSLVSGWHLLQRNVHARGYNTQHVIEWSKENAQYTGYNANTGEQQTGHLTNNDSFVRSLEVGDEIRVIMKCMYPGWSCTVESCEVEAKW